ncbi:MAG: deoxyribonuclease IV [Planctomycetota bacterium]|nr:MAG: deoxyribonuclease IV [Planctomycetota bacterium]
MDLAVLDDLGAHVSVAGGLAKAFERAEEIGAKTIQVFVKNQRQWRWRPLGDWEQGLWWRMRRQSEVREIFAHGTYLLNFASEDDGIFQRSIDTLREELWRASVLGIRGVIFHPGSSEAPIEQAADRIASGLAEVDRDPRTHGALIVLENVAGQGNTVGRSFEQLRAIIDACPPETAERVGVCLDTCHLFAAGYDLRTPEAVRETFEAFDRVLGHSRLVALHYNDSQGELGSRLDRHASIGKGKIGLEGFRALLAYEPTVGIAKILETPTENDGHRRDLETLRSLVV